MEIRFRKPTHWTDGKAFINLRIEKIKEAKRKKEMITVILPEGRCKEVDPKLLMKYGVKTEAVFLYKNNPMKLVGSYFLLQTPEEKAREESKLYFK